ncbi:hypothetical protein ACFQGE_00090 [Halomicroarcula sp. GCM10025817]|uniref:hypothetical protein n=1 Tax=Haloarcula TaxID=2237 RepID=UPI0023E82DEF|nr:hypothetical protein [Halomicroarcula sp. SYNS111]
MQQTGPGHAGTTAVVVAVVLALLVGFVTPGVATGSGDHLSGPVAQQTTPSNETTEQHENPEQVSQQGDAEQVSAWLERRLTSRVEGSAVEISQGEYDQARAVLGDEYNSRLEQYVDVAGETAGTEDDQVVETLRETRERQQEYANATQSYRETYDEYQEAKARGDISGSREHARELERLSERVTTLNESLRRDYTTITNGTGVSTQEAKAATSNTTREITAQQETVRTETFAETRVDVETNGSAVAFDNPIAISGLMTLQNGSAVANQSMEVVVYNRAYETTTDSNGRFTVTYRPVSLPVDATNVTLRTIPQRTSPYLGSSTNISVDVSQVSPSFEIATSPSQAGYSDTVETRVVATVDGRVVPSLPVEASLGPSTVRGATGGSGRVTLASRVTATVPEGSQDIRVRHARAGRAIKQGSTTAPITITGKETTLTVTATHRGAAVRVNGRLATSEGIAVGAQTVTVTVGGTVRSVETSDDGRYQVTVDDVQPADVENTSAVPVTARFDGSGTNLGDSRVETSVRMKALGGSGDGSADGFLGTSTIEILAGVGLGVCALLAAWQWTRRETSSGASPADVSTTQHVGTESEERSQSQQWLAHARSALSANDAEAATIAAYAAIRRQLEERAELSDSLTHHEFLSACRANVEQLDHAALTAVAEAYERATFAAQIDSEAASAAVEGAADLLGSSETDG